MKEKKSSAPRGKLVINLKKIVNAYRILNTPDDIRSGVKGFRLAGLKDQDIFTVLRAMNALKPPFEAQVAFEQDAFERLKPENYDDLVEKFSRIKELPEEEQSRVRGELNAFQKRIDDCVAVELEKDKEIDGYARLGEAAFASLLRDNAHILNASDSLLLMEILV